MLHLQNLEEKLMRKLIVAVATWATALLLLAGGAGCETDKEVIEDFNIPSSGITETPNTNTPDTSEEKDADAADVSEEDGE